MSSTNEFGDKIESGTGPAFPHLSEDLTQLPEIPGGWKTEEFQIGERSLSLFLPDDPDLFLDDAGVLAANEKNDYMPFWAFLWPSSVKMARVMDRAPWTQGSSLLELGSGLGLVGLAAMLRGDVVTFSDHDPTALHLCRMNAVANHLPDPRTMLLDWRAPVAEKFDVIIGCEVTYDAPMHPVILDLLEVMLSDNGVCWLSDPGRYQSPFFYQMAMDRGYEIRIYDEDLRELETPLSGEFQIFELRQLFNVDRPMLLK